MPFAQFCRLAAIALLLPTAAPAYEAILSGIVIARDGDDVRFGKVSVRLQGIAAPEIGSREQPFGREAYEHLSALVDGRRAECRLDGTTASPNRPVGMCEVDGIDLGRHQVESGYARDCPRYSGGRYAEAEARAVARGSKLADFYPLPDYCGSLLTPAAAD